MADTTLIRIPGIALVLANDTDEILAFEDFSTDVEMDVADASAANATWEQVVGTRKKGSGQMGGFLGAEFPNLNVGDEFIPTLVAGAADVSGALKQAQTSAGKCRITKVSDKFNKDPAKVTVDFRWGFAD